MDNDGLYEMTNIVLMKASVVDVEPATVIEDDTHGNLAETADAVEDITPVEQDDDYDTTPHFPEHISLLIREIPNESA